MDPSIARLSNTHPLFATLFARNGPPPMWRRLPTFETVTRLILEQQVSLASANAAYRKLEERLKSVEPERFLTLDDAELKQIGFSRQKASYVRGIADRMCDETLDLRAIADASSDDAMAMLMDVRGIGRWTASCFLLFVAGDPDIWPSGDRALYVSLSRNLDLDGVIAAADADAMADQWRPDRSMAARMLWFDYLGGRSYVPTDSAGFVDGTGMVPA